MAVLLLLPPAQVSGLEAPLCPTSGTGVSVGIPRGPELPGMMAQGSSLVQGGTETKPFVSFHLTPKSPCYVPSESWETG